MLQINVISMLIKLVSEWLELLKNCENFKNCNLTYIV